MDCFNIPPICLLDLEIREFPQRCPLFLPSIPSLKLKATVILLLLYGFAFLLADLTVLPLLTVLVSSVQINLASPRILALLFTGLTVLLLGTDAVEYAVFLDSLDVGVSAFFSMEVGVSAHL